MRTVTTAALCAAFAALMGAPAVAQYTYTLQFGGPSTAVISFPRLPRSQDPVPGTITYEGQQYPASGTRHDSELWIWIPEGTLVLRANHTWVGYDPQGQEQLSGTWE